MSSTLTVLATFQAKAGQEQRLLDELVAMIEPSLAEDGCLAYHPYADPTHDGRVILVEEWRSAAALEHHFTLPHFTRVAAVLEDILAEPFTLRRLTDEPA